VVLIDREIVEGDLLIVRFSPMNFALLWETAKDEAAECRVLAGEHIGENGEGGGDPAERLPTYMRVKPERASV
jgi:hypothetical protein